MRILRTKTLGTRAATLVEVVIAVSIVAISAAGLISALGYGFTATQTLRENQRGTQILLEKAETLRLYNWDQVNSNGFIPSSFTAVYDPQSSGASAGIIYYGNVSVGAFPGGEDYHTNMRQITLTLNWTNANNRGQQRTLVTAIARDVEQNYVW
jgi:type II secretory pathway pseudopilin PulG